MLLFFFWCFAATELARQLHQKRFHVVCSIRVAWATLLLPYYCTQLLLPYYCTRARALKNYSCVFQIWRELNKLLASLLVVGTGFWTSILSPVFGAGLSQITRFWTNLIPAAVPV